jgi:hypothetical protein
LAVQKNLRWLTRGFGVRTATLLPTRAVLPVGSLEWPSHETVASARILILEFQCPSCLAVLIETNALVGQTIQCSHCESSITVPPGSNLSLSDRDIILLPALKMLSPNLARILTIGKGKYWRWARHLDADKLEGIRVNCSEGPDGADYPPPGFKADSCITKPMRAALRLIAKIEDGKAITMAEAKRRIAEDDG